MHAKAITEGLLAKIMAAFLTICTPGNRIMLGISKDRYLPRYGIWILNLGHIMHCGLDRQLNSSGTPVWYKVARVRDRDELRDLVLALGFGTGLVFALGAAGNAGTAVGFINVASAISGDVDLAREPPISRPLGKISLQLGPQLAEPSH